MTRKTRFAPGSNLKGGVTGANWALLLDRLDLGRTLFLGAPSPATLSMVAPLADEVMVWEPQSGKRRALHSWVQESGYCNISVSDEPQVAWQLEELQVDLLVRGNGGSRPAWCRSKLQRLLRRGGCSYFEARGSLRRRALGKQLDPAMRAGAQWLWLTPLQGEIQSAVPLADPRTERYFLKHELTGRNLHLPGLRKAERLIARNAMGARIVRRFGVLHGGAPRRGAPRPPLYLRRLARLNGLDFDRSGWGLWARGEYRSQKAIFFLFEAGQEAPEYVVKMVRDSAFNERLENEYRALSFLRELGPEHRQHVPGAAFLGHPGNLAVVGETAMHGVPFRQRSGGNAGCRHLHEAVEWLTALGAATARPVSGAVVSEAMRDLLERFRKVYRPAPRELVFLEKQIERLASSPHPVPMVFQHGDPGVWNVLVRPNGRVVFMDWEAAEHRGMPLWDLFYFLRSYALLKRVRGLQRRVDLFAHHFFGDSPLAATIQQMTADYCGRVGVHASLVEPLFYTCWMHRALKESNRLQPERLASGRFLGLLQACVERHVTPGLQQLFGTEEAAA
ncbi:MAG: aminoglycoside phosphotransferase family protein [Candidatus Latescibacterota bacterium]|nr:MAG: aminoglycoside phosphotransferase family protein [Candidatus Latescibacterota bacterium]